MIAALLDPAFTGTDLVLCLAALAVAVWGSRHDARKQAAQATDTE